MLQRSRTPKSAESAPPSTKQSSALCCFNGAALRRVRRGRDTIHSRQGIPSFNGAALRRVRRGNRRCHHGRAREGASTEPHSEECGEAQTLDVRRGRSDELQRSRTPKSAESPHVAAKTQAVALLQRSRTPKSAERMEAESTAASRSRLQRSRTPKSAERATANSSPVSTPRRFNGAALRRVRREQFCESVKPNKIRCFNGAALRRVRRG